MIFRSGLIRVALKYFVVFNYKISLYHSKNIIYIIFKSQPEPPAMRRGEPGLPSTQGTPPTKNSDKDAFFIPCLVPTKKSIMPMNWHNPSRNLSSYRQTLDRPVLARPERHQVHNQAPDHHHGQNSSPQKYSYKKAPKWKKIYQNGCSRTQNQAKNELLSNIFNILAGSDPNKHFLAVTFPEKRCWVPTFLPRKCPARQPGCRFQVLPGSDGDDGREWSFVPQDLQPYVTIQWVPAIATGNRLDAYSPTVSGRAARLSRETNVVSA